MDAHSALIAIGVALLTAGCIAAALRRAWPTALGFAAAAVLVLASVPFNLTAP